MSAWHPAGALLEKLEERRYEETEAEHAKRLRAIAGHCTPPRLVLVPPVPEPPAVEPRPPHRPPLPDTPEIRTELIALLAEGWLVADAVQEIGWSESTYQRRRRADPEFDRRVKEVLRARHTDYELEWVWTEVERDDGRHRFGCRSRTSATARYLWDAACICGWVSRRGYRLRTSALEAWRTHAKGNRR